MVVAHVGERQHRDRRLVGLGDFCLGNAFGFGRARAEDDVEHPHREADILQFLLASVLVGKVELVADILAHRARHRHPTRLGDAFDPRRDIDPVAENVVALDDHIAEVDTDAKLDPPLLGDRRIAAAHFTLDVDRAIDRADHAGEFDQHAVAGQFDDPPLVPGDARVDQFGAMLAQARQRADLIGPHSIGCSRPRRRP